MKNIFDAIIVGAGIIGLSVAYELQKRFPDIRISVIEKEDYIAKHQTGNNSGVIHSGIYYKPGSLKALNCIKGYNYLLDFCREEGIPYNICGKIIIAKNEKEIEYLNELYNRGIANGLSEIKLLDQNEIKDQEPEVSGTKGILVPYTGIINFKEVSKKLYEKVIKNGRFFFNNEVVKINYAENEIIVQTGKNKFNGKYLINCGGLYSDHLARLSGIKTDFRIIPFRGEYYYLSRERENIFKRLVYPVPSKEFPFLGVHFTKKIDGRLEAGPNAVLAFKKEGYKKYSFSLFDTWKILSWKGFRIVAYKYWRTGSAEFYRSFSKKAFTNSLRELAPSVTQNDLIPGGAGVRAQACDRNGNLLDDFLILKNGSIINVCNAPSPAATSSLSIAEEIVNNVFGP